MKPALVAVVVSLALLAPARAAPPATRPSAAEAALDAQLARVLPEVKLQSVRLEDAIRWVAEVTGANVWVDWKEVEAGRVTRETPVTLELKNVKVATALALLLREASTGDWKMGYTLDDGVVVIGRKDDAPRPTVVRVYDVRDLVVSAMAFDSQLEDAARALTDKRAPAAAAPQKPADPDPKAPAAAPGLFGGSSPPTATAERVAREDMVKGETTGSIFAGSATPHPLTQPEAADALAHLLQSHITPADWRDAGGTIAACRYFTGKLVVTHTPEGHAAIAAFLDQLRKADAEQRK